MGKTLIIAEKPSVGRDLARVLDDTFTQSASRSHLEGAKYIVSWAIGHLASPADPDKYDEKYKRWTMADLPIIPAKFKLAANDSDAAKQLKSIKELMHRKDVTGVINACDAGREGELIFAYIYQLCRAKKPVERLWLSSMTDKAIKDAFAALRPGAEFKPLEDAARSRSEADWIVGMNATRAATVKTRGAFDGAVSLGRVQTPTLAMIVRRELQILNFNPEPYWTVKALFNVLGDAPGSDTGSREYKGTYLGGKKLTPEQAHKIVAESKGQTGIVSKMEKKEAREACDLLYDLTTLQRQANQRYGFSATRTLASAQKLYEQHKALTYPRTNSRYLTADMAAEIKPTAEALSHQTRYKDAAQYVMDLADLNLKRVVNDKKVEDHHAIIPTKSEQEAGYMEDDERKIYDLVVKRFLAIFHPDAIWEKTKIETTVQGHVFRTSGKVLHSAGWRSVYGTEGLEDQDEKKADEDNALLPVLKEGESARAAKVKADEKITKPPKRYNESTLLGAMETAGKDIDDDALREAMKESGIGTPATRAAIIERLLRVGYISRSGKQLIAEPKGVDVITLLDEHPITSAELTGSWEARLSHIEHGTDSRKAFMADINAFAHEIVKRLDGLTITVTGLGPCPSCKRPVLETSKSYGCWTPDDPGCGFTIWKDKASKQIPERAVRELIENGVTTEKVSGFREGAGGAGKSFAAHLKLYKSEHGRWQTLFADPDLEERFGKAALDKKSEICRCPICKKPVYGGAKSYSCWTAEDPGCGFTVWKTISGYDVTPQVAKELIKKKRSAEPVVMRSRAGKQFAAYLVLMRRIDDGSAVVRFDFDGVDQNVVLTEHVEAQARAKAEREAAKKKRARAKATNTKANLF